MGQAPMCTGSLWEIQTAVRSQCSCVSAPLHTALRLWPSLAVDASLCSYHSGTPSACLLKQLFLFSCGWQFHCQCCPVDCSNLGCSPATVWLILIWEVCGREADIKGEWTVGWTLCEAGTRKWRLESQHSYSGINISIFPCFWLEICEKFKSSINTQKR